MSTVTDWLGENKQHNMPWIALAHVTKIAHVIPGTYAMVQTLLSLWLLRFSLQATCADFAYTEYCVQLLSCYYVVRIAQVLQLIR